MMVRILAYGNQLINNVIQNIISVFYGRDVSKLDDVTILTKEERINNLIQNKPSKSFSAYKIRGSSETSFSIFFVKRIAYLLDRYILTSESNEMRKKNFLNETDTWGVDSQQLISISRQESKKLAEDLLKKFDDNKMAYLLIYPSIDQSTKHAAMFLGAANENNIYKIKNYVSVGPADSFLKSDIEYCNLQENICSSGLPEIIPMPNLDIPAMKQHWKQIRRSNIQYRIARENCASIIGNLIDWGLGIKSEEKSISLFYSPEQLRKRGFQLMLKDTEKNYNEISSPVTTRKIFIKNQQQQLFVQQLSWLKKI